MKSNKPKSGNSKQGRIPVSPAGQTRTPQQHGNRGDNQNQRVQSSQGQRGGGQHGTRGGAGLSQQQGNQNQRGKSSPGQRGGGHHGTRGGAGLTGILPQQHGNRDVNQNQRVHSSLGQRGGGQHGTRDGAGQTGNFHYQHGNRDVNQNLRVQSSQGQRGGGHHGTRDGACLRQNFPHQQGNRDVNQNQRVQSSQGQRGGGHHGTRHGAGLTGILPQQHGNSGVNQIQRVQSSQGQRGGGQHGTRDGAGLTGILPQQHGNRGGNQNQRVQSSQGQKGGGMRGGAGLSGSLPHKQGNQNQRVQSCQGERGGGQHGTRDGAGQTGMLSQQHGNRGGNQNRRVQSSRGQRGGGQHIRRDRAGQSQNLPRQHRNRGGNYSQRGQGGLGQRDHHGKRGVGNHVFSVGNWSGYHYKADIGQLPPTQQGLILSQQFSQNSLPQMPPCLDVSQNQQQGRGMSQGLRKQNGHRLRKRPIEAVKRQYPCPRRPLFTFGEKEAHRYNKLHGQKKLHGIGRNRFRGDVRKQIQSERRVGNTDGACGGERASQDESEWESEEDNETEDDNENEEEFSALKDTVTCSSSQKDSVLETDVAESSPICDRHLVDKCKMSGCKYHHIDSIKLPYIWQIKMPQSWLTLEKQQIIEVERAYCNREDNFRAMVFYGDRNYIATLEFNKPDTLSAELVADGASTKFTIRTSVRRLSTVSYTKGYQPSAEDSFKTQWRWFYTNDLGNWLLYEPDLLQFTLEQKFTWKCQDSYLFFRKKYQFKYCVDFRSMTQINMETREERKLLRRPLFVSAEDVESKHCPETIVIKTGVDEPLPKAWVPWDLAHTFELVELKQNSTEFKKVYSSFFRTLDPQEFQICYIFRVQNMELWISYCGQKKSMNISLERSGQTKEVDERNLFHGTDSLNIVQGICTNGFDFRLCGKHGTVYGKGAYFAQNSKYSHGYTDNFNTSAMRYMFLAKVLIGEYTVGSSSYARPPEKPGGTAHQLFDSCVDNIDNPSIFVVFDLKQCYPEYLICYRRLEELSVSEATLVRPSENTTPFMVEQISSLPDQSVESKSGIHMSSSSVEKDVLAMFDPLYCPERLEESPIEDATSFRSNPLEEATSLRPCLNLMEEPTSFRSNCIEEATSFRSNPMEEATSLRSNPIETGTSFWPNPIEEATSFRSDTNVVPSQVEQIQPLPF